MTKSAFASNLAYIRKMRGWKQERMATFLGISRPTLGSYEEGRAEPSIDVFLKICSRLAVGDPYGFYRDYSFFQQDGEAPPAPLSAEDMAEFIQTGLENARMTVVELQDNMVAFLKRSQATIARTS